MTFYPYSPLIIDLTFKDYIKLFARFFTSNDRSEIQNSLEDVFLKDKQKEKLIPTLSVRTAFDLFLQAADFTKGSEIIMTGINIPDMPAIVTNHGLVPVPVDLDIDKLAPKIEDIEKHITPNTRAILVSYIFGAIFNIDEIVKLAKKHGLYVIEDLAEAFMGQDYNGHPEADISLFSFGAIKYNTSLNGALAVVRNSEVFYNKMMYILERYPSQTVSTYFKKCCKLIVPALITNNRFMNKAFRKIGRMISENFEEFGISLLRGFPQTTGDFLSKYRYQICTPLLANLAARMIAFNQKKFQDDIRKIKAGQDLLLEAGIQVPGHKADTRSFWLFPIIVSDVQGCKKLLNERGVNAYVGATQLKIVESGTKEFSSPEKTREFFDKMVYLPIQKNIPESLIIEICKVTIETINDVEKRQMPN